jgi:hypothetical protein
MEIGRTQAWDSAAHTLAKKTEHLYGKYARWCIAAGVDVGRIKTADAEIVNVEPSETLCANVCGARFL